MVLGKKEGDRDVMYILARDRHAETPFTSTSD